jgi:hypothetical protein
LEQIDSPSPPTSGTIDMTASVRSIVVEVAAYAGVAMGLVGTFVLLATTAQPSDTTLLLVAVAVTAVLFAAGIAISKDTASSNQRLRSVLWFAALLGCGVVVEGVLVVAEIDLEGRSRLLLSGGLVAAAAVGLWIGLRRSLQLLGMFVSLFGVLSAAVFPQPDPFGGSDFVVSALLSWLFGTAWLALGARGVVQPARTALVLGTITVLVSPFALTAGGPATESTLTVVELWVLAGSVACLTVGSWLADRAVQGLAIVGVLVSIAVLAADLFGSSQGRSIAAVVIGIALLGGAVFAIRASRPAIGSASPPPTGPPLPPATVPEPPPS